MQSGDAALQQLSIASQQSSAYQFVDECIIYRPGAGQGTRNEDTGQYDDPPDEVVVYEGPCRMQVRADINSNVVETSAGGREWTYLTSQVQLPLDGHPDIKRGSSADVRTDDICRWTATGASGDPAMVDRLFNIAGPFHKTHASKRRFRVREVVA